MSKVHRLAAAVILLAGAAAGASDASARWHAWRTSRREFPLAAWSYFGRESKQKDLAIYRAAGLTMVQVPLAYVGEAKRCGLDVVLGSWQGLWRDEEKLKRYVGLPSVSGRSVAGYMLRDEPKPGLFPALGRAHATIYAHDARNALPMVDLLPNWAVNYGRFHMSYRQFLTKFVTEVQPAVLMNCHYPIDPNGTYRDDFYSNAELLREFALRYDIGLMGFVLVNDWKRPAIPSESDLRWIAHSLLAYGAKGLWYWNYQIDDRKLGQGMVDGKTGAPRRVYPLVRKLNREIQALGKTLLSLRSTVVLHTGPDVPKGATRWAKNRLRAIDDLEAERFLVGEFTNQDDAADRDVYVMFVNKRHAMDKAPQDLKSKVIFTTYPEFRCVAVYTKEGGGRELLPDLDGRYAIGIGGGNAALVRFCRDAGRIMSVLARGEGAASKVVALAAAADVDVRSDAPKKNFDRPDLVVGRSNRKTQHAYLRFDLPADFGRAIAARVALTRSSAGAWFFTYQMVAMPEAGSWDETRATWQEQPGGGLPEAAQVVGWIKTQGARHGGKAGDTYSVKTQALVDAINRCQGGSVTFALRRVGTPSTSFDAFASAEHGKLPGPTLELRYVPK